MKDKIVIASRGSKLALVQANHIKTELEKSFKQTVFEILIVKTTGDIINDVPLSKIPDKGMFIKEIEEALLNGSADLAVHSMKDVPVDLAGALLLGAITKREDNHDILISKTCGKLAELKKGAVIGTSSLRRIAQLKHFRMDLQIKDLRGNLDTRIKKLESGAYDGIILALAGIRRLGLESLVSEIIPYEIILPSVGQGALGIELRKGDEEIKAICAVLNDNISAAAVLCERALLKELGGGCQVPVGANAGVYGNKLVIEASVTSPDGKVSIKDKEEGLVEDSAALGQKLAQKLIRQNAKKIIENKAEKKP